MANIFKNRLYQWEDRLQIEWKSLVSDLTGRELEAMAHFVRMGYLFKKVSIAI